MKPIKFESVRKGMVLYTGDSYGWVVIIALTDYFVKDGFHQFKYRDVQDKYNTELVLGGIEGRQPEVYLLANPISNSF